jgi:hypothetical protein
MEVCIVSESKSKKYYVYIWYIEDTNEIFYIGKGSGYRYRTFWRENKRFVEIATHNTTISEVLVDNLTESEALEYERALIDYAIKNNYPLVNMQRGGLQPVCAGKNHGNKNASKDELKHRERSQAIKELWAFEEYANAHRGANNSRSQGVRQFDLDGNFIKEYETLTEASNETGVTVTKICAVCKGRRKTSGGYVWKYSDDKHQTSSRKNYVYNPDNYKSSKPVLQLDKEGNLINEYYSINDVVRKNPKMKRYAIQQNLYGKSKSSYGFIWKFK